jgi:hypothetical protein
LNTKKKERKKKKNPIIKTRAQWKVVGGEKEGGWAGRQ